jgi:hypothetical protein
MRTWLVGFVCAALFVSVHAQSRPVKRLDLTVPDSTAATEATTMTVMGGSSSAALPLPLRLTLTRLNNDQYREGDALVFEVAITNIGQRPVRLPWSRRKSEFANHRLSEVVRGQISLDLVDGAGRRHAGPAVILAGLTTDGTSTELNPGEQVVIVAPQRWVFRPKARAWLDSASAQIVKVSARLHLDDGDTAYKDVTSTDSVEVTLIADQKAKANPRKP